MGARWVGSLVHSLRKMIANIQQRPQRPFGALLAESPGETEGLGEDEAGPPMKRARVEDWVWD